MYSQRRICVGMLRVSVLWWGIFSDPIQGNFSATKRRRCTFDLHVLGETTSTGHVYWRSRITAKRQVRNIIIFKQVIFETSDWFDEWLVNWIEMLLWEMRWLLGRIQTHNIIHVLVRSRSSALLWVAVMGLWNWEIFLNRCRKMSDYSVGRCSSGAHVKERWGRGDGNSYIL